ncbi:hypothetical protein HMPREF1870_00635 [Bacteroidales bacterium KA00344]|nr:hypothetical protein HMPREF1870_00635 [Bacteroidales bacterium KA00344]
MRDIALQTLCRCKLSLPFFRDYFRSIQRKKGYVFSIKINSDDVKITRATRLHSYRVAFKA